MARRAATLDRLGLAPGSSGPSAHTTYARREPVAWSQRDDGPARWRGPAGRPGRQAWALAGRGGAVRLVQLQHGVPCRPCPAPPPWPSRDAGRWNQQEAASSRRRSVRQSRHATLESPLRAAPTGWSTGRSPPEPPDKAAMRTAVTVLALAALAALAAAKTLRPRQAGPEYVDPDVLKEVFTSTPPPAQGERFAQDNKETLSPEFICSIFGGPSCPVDEQPPYEPCLCDDPAGGCQCVPYYQCDKDSGSFNQFGVGVIDIRQGNSSCSHYINKCCKPAKNPPKFPPKDSSPPPYSNNPQPSEPRPSEPRPSEPQPSDPQPPFTEVPPYSPQQPSNPDEPYPQPSGPVNPDPDLYPSQPSNNPDDSGVFNPTPERPNYTPEPPVSPENPPYTPEQSYTPEPSYTPESPPERPPYNPEPTPGGASTFTESPPFSPPPQPGPNKCGVRNPEGIGVRITGDEDGEAQFGEFPWMVAILKVETNEGDKKHNLYQCGGALITPQVVLTAAHCVKQIPPRRLKVRAGEWDTQTAKEMYRHQDVLVEDVTIHPEYYAGAVHNDVALLYLNDPVHLGYHISTICMPEQDQNFDYNKCFVSGWGKDKFGQQGRYQVILKKLELPMVPNDECQAQLRKTRLGHHFVLHDSFVCAGGQLGKDTCKGDGGSPLVCPMPGHPGTYQLAGVVAWGIDCGLEGVPGVYGRVSKFRHWVDQELRAHNIDDSPYLP